MVEIIDNEGSFDGLKEKWLEVEKNPKLAIFQAFLWCREGWNLVSKTDGNSQLWILKWTQDGKEDVVFFPFYIDGNGVLRFILDLHNDSNDAVYSGDTINRYWVYREVADAIKKETRIKRVWLQKMRGGSEALDYLSVFLPGAVVSKDNAYAYIRVDSAGDFFDSQLHWRSDNRKHARKLLRQADAYLFSVLRKDKNQDFPETEITRLISEMESSGCRARGFMPKEMVEFAKTIYDAGKCEIPVFVKDGKVVSLEFRLIKGACSLDWIYLTTDPRTGSEINVKYCSEWAKTNSGIVDFGVGAYEYKILTMRPMVAPTFSIRVGRSAWQFGIAVLGAIERIIKDYIKSKKNG